MEPTSPSPTPATPPTLSDTRVQSALIIAVVGLLIPAVLILWLNRASKDGTTWSAAEITAAAGLFTSVVGTLVGAFLGVQVGAAGKQQSDERATQAEQRATQAEQQRAAAQDTAMRAAGLLDPGQAAALFAPRPSAR
ncbi:hypothetical protein [Hymenobacter pini]|uniref:hypothetical protein n=1 Tax=Hymenobacter pini TaxID=2880879 RepID=UPI001CF4E265|nr:hypothetical protein [Hymenobacter pini]MCA8832371.1 hypothetical protein [Hymenobacter pini]